MGTSSGLQGTMTDSAVIPVTPVTPGEREFFWTWTRTRHLEDVYAVLSLTIWVRVKHHVCQLLKFTEFTPLPREVCMIICIHISMKYLGYDELFKCKFRDDLAVTAETHRKLEFSILQALDWTIEDLGGREW